MMNKRSDILSGIVLLCFLIGVSVPLFANQKEAKEVLDKTASAFRQSGGIQATFTVQTYVKSKLQNTSSGNIRLKGDKFLLDAEGVKTWFDGRTQWSYVAGNDEVNVAQPTSEELQSINPYAFLSIYEKGYDLKVGKKTVYAGKSVYEIILTAKNNKSDLQCVILYVTKDKLEPICISMAQRGGGSVAIRVNTYQSGLSFADSMFVFNKKDYPSAEIVDLR
jgi:outer membrane lipoprotein-sorting protein